MFGENSEPFQPLTSSQFKQALERFDGDSYREQIGNAVDSAWNAALKDGEPVYRGNHPSLPPSYREHQREAVIDTIEQLYIDDKDVVLLSAPTGSGKSLLINAIAGVIEEVRNKKSFITTPLNTLIDQVDNDQLLEDTITVKGRNNYSCVHPEDAGTPVDSAICQRDSDFDCQYKDMPHTEGGCPYYGRVRVAQDENKVVTNLSYLMANSMIPDMADAGFDRRELLAIDECQNIEDFALMFVGFVISENLIPIDFDKIPDMPGEDSSMEEAMEWIEKHLMAQVTERINQLEAKKDSITMTNKEQDDLDKLRQFNQRVANFMADVEQHHWAKNHSSYPSQKIKFEPIFVGRFLDNYLWSQCNKVVAASATIPPSFIEEVGLDQWSEKKSGSKQIGRVEVESTFPPERRPVITSEAVGKMSWKERDKTLPKMADQIGRIAEVWQAEDDAGKLIGHRGFVHCNSYKIAEKIYDRLPWEVQQRTRLQDSDNREESLQAWMDAPIDEKGSYHDEGGQVFLSVAMDEGISLDDELCRWQVVAKASYPHMQDERVSYRMDNNTMGGADWNWYSSKAAINLQQAVGRGMRSKDDWCATYLLDTSAVQLIERNKHLFEDWFLDAVDVDFDTNVVSPSNTDYIEEQEPSGSGSSSLDDIADEYC